MNSSTNLNRSFGSPNKNLSPILRSKSNKNPLVKSRPNRLIISPQKEEAKAQFKISQETKTLAINLNKHKLEEEENFLKPQYVTQLLSRTAKNKHRLECDCFISEVQYQMYASQLLTLNKLFICCRTAASDLPQLLSNNIHSIISIGEEPNNFPSIRGGYKNLPFEGSYHKLVAPVFAFLTSQNFKGNVLVCDESGKGAACVMVMCFLMKYLKINYIAMIEIMKNSRKHFTIGEAEENFIKAFDQHKIG
jgi:hypothetical protein